MEIKQKNTRERDKVVARGNMNADRITLKTERDNVFALQVDAGHKVERRAQKMWVMAVVLLVVFVAGLVLPRSVAFQVLSKNGYLPSGWIIDLQTNVDALVQQIALGIPSPLAITDVIVALAGAGLGMTGAVYQGSLRNALAAPSTLGVMSGAALGSCIFILLFVSDDPVSIAYMSGAGAEESALLELPLTDYVWTMWGQSFCSLLGCALVAALLLAVVRLAGKRKVSNIMLIIIGQIIGSVAGSVVSIARYYYLIVDPYGNKAMAFETLQAATFYRDFGIVDLLCIGIPLLVVLGIVLYMAPRLTLLAFKDDEARAMGVDTRKWRVGMVAVCTVLVAIIVSFCGTVGFVGFLVPHLTRKLVGPDFKYLIPASALVGAIFTLGAWDVLGFIWAGYSEAVGMIISIAGGVVFLSMALRQREATRGDWT